MNKENLPIIGNLIKQKLKEHERSIAWLAKKVNYSHTGLCKILKQNHINTVLLLQISEILKCDFFEYYSSLLRDIGIKPSLTDQTPYNNQT